jgi:hypothetical protein
MTERRALLLGMVYSKETNPSRGQGYRDRVRCESLEQLSPGYIVDTLDNKHDETLAKDLHHCCTNFADIKRMTKSLSQIWNFQPNISSPRYDLIILDYFFSPAGWVNTRWTEKFFSITLPFFIEKKLLKENGQIWLPNNLYVQEMVQKYSEHLLKYYNYENIFEPKKNPLYEATDIAREKLLLCPDNITNETQIPYLTSSSGGAFLCFQPKNREKKEKKIRKKYKTTVTEGEREGEREGEAENRETENRVTEGDSEVTSDETKGKKRGRKRKERTPAAAAPGPAAASEGVVEKRKRGRGRGKGKGREESEEEEERGNDENALNQDILILSEDETSNLTTLSCTEEDSNPPPSSATTANIRRFPFRNRTQSSSVGV